MRTGQRGTVRTFYYDKLPRLTDDCVTTMGSDTDDAVLRIPQPVGRSFLTVILPFLTVSHWPLTAGRQAAQFSLDMRPEVC